MSNNNEEKKFENLKAELEKAKAELESLKAERDGLKVALAAPLAGVKQYLNEQVPALFDYDQFPVNKKQNMAIHREFVKEALKKLIDGLAAEGAGEACFNPASAGEVKHG